MTSCKDLLIAKKIEMTFYSIMGPISHLGKMARTSAKSENPSNNKFVIMLKRNSIKFMANTRPHTDSSHYRNENRLAVWVILEIFWTVSLKAHDWSSWILTECSLSWKIVKYRILTEVCIINSTVSPQMWCIKNIKGWFTHTQVCWREFVKYTCRTQKNSAWFVFQEFVFQD